MIVIRHGFHNVAMTCMLQISESTMHKIIVVWIVSRKTIFSCLNLKPDGGFLLYNKPEVFIKIEHGLTDTIIWPKLKLNKPSNYDLNTLSFSDYKNKYTGKALV